MAGNVGVGHASPMCTEEGESTAFEEGERIKFSGRRRDEVRSRDLVLAIFLGYLVP